MPKRRLPVEELVPREYWTPGEARRVLGMSEDFWQRAFDAGHIDGRRDDTKRAVRRLSAKSARSYLLIIGVQQQTQVPSANFSQAAAQRTRAWRRKRGHV